MENDSKIHLAVLSGMFGTAGGVFAKLAGFYSTAEWWSLSVKMSLLIIMVTSNTIGCTLFVKCMASSTSSLPATVASSTVNYVCSALLGWLIFGESTSLLWWCGTSLVLLGLLLICCSPKRRDDDEKQRKQQ